MGKFLLYLGTELRTGFWWLYYAALAVHAAESAVAVVLCRRMGLTGRTTLKWFANTAVHGGFALKFLIGKAKLQGKGQMKASLLSVYKYIYFDFGFDEANFTSTVTCHLRQKPY